MRSSLVFFMSLLSDSNQRPRDYKSRALWVSLPYRAATTNYLCCDQALEDSKGAGRMGLTRISKNVQLMTVSCATFLDCGCKGRRFF